MRECSDCQFFKPDEYEIEGSPDEVELGDEGECHGSTPQPIMDAFMPQMDLPEVRLVEGNIKAISDDEIKELREAQRHVIWPRVSNDDFCPAWKGTGKK